VESLTTLSSTKGSTTLRNVRSLVTLFYSQGLEYQVLNDFRVSALRPFHSHQDVSTPSFAIAILTDATTIEQRSRYWNNIHACVYILFQVVLIPCLHPHPFPTTVALTLMLDTGEDASLAD